MNIEELVSNTILQEPTSIEVGGKTISIAPPSTATLIKLSAELSTLPKITIETDDEKAVQQALSVAKDCKAIGRAVAVLILGARNTTEVVTYRKKVLGLPIGAKVVEKRDNIEPLAEYLLQSTTPTDLWRIILVAIGGLQTLPFLNIITSLTAMQITRPTKNETTAYGQ